MSDEEIHLNRVAGEITLVLKHGSTTEKESLLRAVEQAAGPEDRARLERWLADGLPGA